MNEISLGNWVITPNGIKNINANHYLIEKEALEDVILIENTRVYDFPIHIATKTWISEEDLYTFNTVFLIALDYFNIPINSEVSLAATFITQKNNFFASR